MRGRKPHPTIRRVLTGNAGKRPLNTEEPTPPPVTEAFEAPPPELEDNPRATAEWIRLAPLLRASRQVTEADRAALIALCVEWARYLEAMARVAALGMIIPAPSGYPITNPYLAIATKALSGCQKLWPELGLTPSSRTRVKMAGPPDQADEFAEFDRPPSTVLERPPH